MPALTNTDVGALVRELNASYQPLGLCAATPRRMKKLLTDLEEYTDEVQWARNKYKALGVASIAFGPAGVGVAELLGGGDVDVAQWRRDMANWQYRLAEYHRILDAVPPEMMDTVEGCREIYPLVTAPLLDGLHYQVMPGIVLNADEKRRIKTGTGHCPEGVTSCVDVPYRESAEGDHPEGHSNPKPPDAISPFTLGNQIIVYQDFQKENLRRFIDDLLKGAAAIVDPDEWPWWVWAVIVAGGGIAVGLLGLYAYQFLPKAPSRSNPRRRNPATKATARKVVQLAAARTKEPRVKSWLQTDPEGTWESMALAALKEGIPKGKQAGMSETQVIDAAASFIKTQALEASKGVA